MTRAAPTTASRLLAVLATALAVLLVVVGCGGSSTPAGGGGSSSAAAATAGGDAVTIKDFAFSPASITVAAGTKIKVTNSDSVTHTLTADDKTFDTSSIAPGQTAELTAPSKPGKYPFHCTPHPFMTGTLTVS